MEDTSLHLSYIHTQLQRLVYCDITTDIIEGLSKDIHRIGTGLYEAAEIIKWNIDRGCHLNVSTKLERTMLTSEIREAYASETIVDLVDAIADIIFVAVGTWAKLMYANLNIDNEDDYPILRTLSERTILDYSGYSLYSTHTSSYSLVLYYARQELLYRIKDCTGSYLDTVDSIIQSAVNIVIDANNLKPKERDSNGKIIKGDKWVAPEPRLREMLINYGVDVDTPLLWDYKWMK